MKLNLDFFIHWLWTATYGLLALSGLALMGAKYGWVLNYQLALADYVHRTMAVFYVVLLAMAILLEILRIIINYKVNVWMMVGVKDYQVFTLITTLIFIITGIFIWVCMEFSKAAFSFSLILHEIVTYITMASIIWHIYMKAHSLKT